MKHDSKRRANGSALIMVLGILSIIMMMAVAFSVFMRTERAGVTSLRNSYVACEMLHSAVANVTDIIDSTFNSPTNDWPAVTWRYPWLSSGGDLGDGISTNGASAGARLLTPEMARYLTPAQLAFVQNSTINWNYLRSGVNVNSLLSSYDGHPAGDTIVGRYAFIALDNTGLLDLNVCGGGESGGKNSDTGFRSETYGEEPAAFIVSEDSSDHPLVSVKDAARFFSKRKSARDPFTSFADALSMTDDSLHYGTLEDYKRGNDYELPADVFATSSLSLDGLTPQKTPKIALPTWDVIDTLGKSKLKKYITDVFAPRSLEAMMRVFSEVRKRNSSEGVDEGADDDLVFFCGMPFEMHISRARLAVVAMLDAMDVDESNDPDFKPGSGYGIDSYWRDIDALSQKKTLECNPLDVKGDGNKIDDPVDAKNAYPFVTKLPSKDAHLNVPCTEPIPMTSWAYAYFDPVEDRSPFTDGVKWQGGKKLDGKGVPGRSRAPKLDDEDGDDTGGGGTGGGGTGGGRRLGDEDDGDPGSGGGGGGGIDDSGVRTDGTWWKNETLTVTRKGYVGAYATAWNYIASSIPDSGSEKSRKYKVKLDWKVMDSIPTKGGVVCGDCSGKNDPLMPDLLSSNDEDVRSQSANRVRWTMAAKSGSVEGSEASLDYSLAGSSPEVRTHRLFQANDEVTVEIKCAARGWKVVTNGGNVSTNIVYFWPTELENRINVDKDKSASNVKDVYLPFAIKVSVIDDNNDVVQQVPAPLLESSTTGEEKEAFWLRADAGVYHGSKSDMPGHQESFGKMDPGWVYCLVPEFGFDTTSLRTRKLNASVIESDPFDAGNGMPDSTAPGSHDGVPGVWINNAIARAKRSEIGAFGDLIDGVRADPEHLYVDVDAIGRDDIWMGLAMRTVFKRTGNRDGVLKWISRPVRHGGHVPDSFHSLAKSGSLFIADTAELGEMYTRVINMPFRSPADLGNVRIGPHETLSLFETYRAGANGDVTGDADLHRILDYWTASGGDRYPSVENWAAGDVKYEWTGSTPKITVSKSDMKKHPVYSAFSNGKANINMQLPPLVYVGKYMTIDDADIVPNTYPLVSTLMGAPYSSQPKGTNDKNVKTVGDEEKLIEVLEEFQNSLDNSNEANYPRSYDSKGGSSRANVNRFQRRRGMAARLSDIGKADSDGSHNRTLGKWIANFDAKNDDEREGMIRGAANAFATRGQNFLVLLRADAYTTMFGIEDTTDSDTGTTLSKTRAIVELFRDPEPVRLPDGSYPKDKDGNPIVYHSWLVKSFRTF